MWRILIFARPAKDVSKGEAIDAGSKLKDTHAQQQRADQMAWFGGQSIVHIYPLDVLLAVTRADILKQKRSAVVLGNTLFIYSKVALDLGLRQKTCPLPLRKLIKV